MTTDAARLLDRGERLLWTGKPNLYRFALSKGLAVFVFGIFFFGFAVFWISMARRAPSNFWLFGVLHVSVGMGMLLWPFWQGFRAMQTRYMLTDRRTIVDTTAPFPRRLSIPLNQISFVELRQRSDDLGDVLFQETRVFGHYGHGLFGHSPSKDGFIAIEGPAKVEQLLRTAIDGADDAGPRKSAL